MSGKTRKIKVKSCRMNFVRGSTLRRYFISLCLLSLPVLSLPGYVRGSERLERKKQESKRLRQLLRALFMVEDDLSQTGGQRLQDGHLKKFQELLNITTEKIAEEKRKDLKSALEEAILIRDVQTKRTLFKTFRHELLTAFEVDSAPALPPGAKTGELIFKKDCVSCHGSKGYGNGPLSQKLPVKPGSWKNETHLQSKVPLMILNALIEGSPGTPMPSFEAIYSHQELWSLSFYVPCLAFIDRLEQRQKEWQDLTDSTKKIFLSRGLTYSFLARRSDAELKKWIDHLPLPAPKESRRSNDDWLEILRGGAAFSKGLPRK